MASAAAEGQASQGAAGRAGRQGVGLVAFDLDGVIYRGSLLLPHVPETLADLERRGLPLRFVTNNSTKHRREVAQILRDLGVPAEPEQVLSSAAATATWLRAHAPRAAEPLHVLYLGEKGLGEELADAGFHAVHALESGPEDATRADYVVVGLDRTFNYDSLARAQAALLAGAQFLATNGDYTYPAEEGLMPGAGAMVAAVAAASGVAPTVMGKPHDGLAEALQADTGIPASRTLLVGDRLETDIEFGRQHGMLTALVLTGVTSAEHLADSSITPDYVLTDLAGLPGLLDRLEREERDR